MLHALVSNIEPMTSHTQIRKEKHDKENILYSPQSPFCYQGEKSFPKYSAIFLLWLVLPTLEPITCIRMLWLAPINHDSLSKTKHGWPEEGKAVVNNQWCLLNQVSLCSFPPAAAGILPMFPIPSAFFSHCVLVLLNFFQFLECSIYSWHLCLAVPFA